ncbi:hypothetical protein BT69DRAFT_1288498 [Atractiella rhizophila]|nr:hypothetical protein BT69DRAFT_1288498 [Atractiella rhizophila]
MNSPSRHQLAELSSGQSNGTYDGPIPSSSSIKQSTSAVSGTFSQVLAPPNLYNQSEADLLAQYLLTLRSTLGSSALPFNSQHSSPRFQSAIRNSTMDGLYAPSSMDRVYEIPQSELEETQALSRAFSDSLMAMEGASILEEETLVQQLSSEHTLGQEVAEEERTEGAIVAFGNWDTNISRSELRVGEESVKLNLKGLLVRGPSPTIFPMIDVI